MDNIRRMPSIGRTSDELKAKKPKKSGQPEQAADQETGENATAEVDSEVIESMPVAYLLRGVQRGR